MATPAGAAASFQPMCGMAFFVVVVVVVIVVVVVVVVVVFTSAGSKRTRERGMSARPDAAGSSAEPANSAWRPTQMPINGLPEAMWAWMAGR